MTAATDEILSTSFGLPCHLVDPDIFFAEAPAEIEYAKTLCVDCPAKAECLSTALARREVCGVWGGELLVNGVIVARKRPRGRPRKNPAPLVPQAPVNLRGPVVPGEPAPLKRDRNAA